jgi:Bifunctional DNA primase/polymerase, N-terminal
MSEHPPRLSSPSVQGSTAMTAGWRELRSAAISATRWGWPVVPGTYLGADRHWHGRDTAMRLCPIQDTWQDTPVTDPKRAEEIWGQQPYGVLLVCGRGVDVLELPHRMRGLLCALAPGGPVVPVAATGAPPRFLVFTATGPGTLAGDLTLAKVRLHGAGAWVALPPTTVGFLFPQRWWTAPPEHGRTRLRPAQPVQDVLVDALLASGLGTGTDDDEE